MEYKIVHLKCKGCEVSFERNEDYLQQDRTDPIFKWKLEYCDECVDRKIAKILTNDLPKIIDILGEQNNDN